MKGQKEIRWGVDGQPNAVAIAETTLNIEGKYEGLRLFERYFPPGMDGCVNKGLDKSRAAQRRKKRSTRVCKRNSNKRKKSLKNIFKELFGLRVDDFGKLNEDLRKEYYHCPQKFIYGIRKKALDFLITEEEFASLVWHLHNGRGCNVNDIIVPKNDSEEDIKKKQKELTDKKKAIVNLRNMIKSSGSRTAGEYFYDYIDSNHEKIKGNIDFTLSRDIIIEEYDKICDSQIQLGNSFLTENKANKIKDVLFHCHPLKSQKGNIAKCTFEVDERCVPKYNMDFQLFRALSELNNAKIIDDGQEEDLGHKRWEILKEKLMTVPSLSYDGARRLLGLSKDCRFNFESSKRKKDFVGCKTRSDMIGIFGEDEWIEYEKSNDAFKIVHEIASCRDKKHLKKRMIKHWGVAETIADKLCEVELESEYASLSLKAVHKILEGNGAGLLAGEHYSTVVKSVYGNMRFEPLSLFPPVVEFMGEINNPNTIRFLSQFRMLANPIIEDVGKPDKMFIELARELKQSKKGKKEHEDRNNARETLRKKAHEKLQEKIPKIKKDSNLVKKVMLAEECGYIDVYTGNTITIEDIISGYYDIEHVVPKCVVNVNHWNNLLLCSKDYNAKKKKDRMPSECMSKGELEECCNRMSKNFKNDGIIKHSERVKAKQEVFRTTDKDDFVSKYGSYGQLTKTGMVENWTGKFSTSLYGGYTNTSGKRVVNLSNGKITSIIRGYYGLNLLDENGKKKNRDNLKHHAIDAFAISLINQGMINALNVLNKKGIIRDKEEIEKVMKKHGIVDDVEKMRDDLREALDSLIIDRYHSHKISGSLHKDNASKMPDENGQTTVRRSLSSMTMKQVKTIKGDTVRKAVEDKIAESDFKESRLSDIFKDDDVSTLPRLPNGTIVRKVSCNKTLNNAFEIGRVKHKRYFGNESIHHMEVFEDKKGKLICRSVNLLEVNLRKVNKQKIIDNEWDNNKFLFPVFIADAFEFEKHDGEKKIYNVASIGTNKQVCFVANEEARAFGVIKNTIKDEMKEFGFSKNEGQKIQITPSQFNVKFKNVRKLLKE